METKLNNPLHPDANRIGSRMSRISPDIFRSEGDNGPFSIEASDDEPVETEENLLSDEPVDEDGDPTDMPDQGEHDHHQDENYALGGHVTRSGSV